MHEVGIVQSVLDLAEAEARKANATRIVMLQLRVGQLTGVVPEALDHAFVVLRTGTLAAEGQLCVDYVPARAWCSQCQAEFQTPGLYSECPTCGLCSLEIRGGLEMQLVSLEVE